jgi:hypothetical protein
VAVLRSRQSARFARSVPITIVNQTIDLGGVMRLVRIFAAVVVLLCGAVSALAMPVFLDAFRKDPFRRANVPNMDSCSVCHVNPQGGGERNPFGQAFENGGETITPMLRAQFPDRFAYPTSRTGENLVIYFSDPENKQVVVESAGVKSVIDVASRSLNGTPAATSPTAAVAAAAPAAPTRVARSGERSEVPVDPYAREGAFFGMQVVNLPNGKPVRKGGVDFLLGHRFSTNVSDAGLGGLFGFDSVPTVAYGARVGVTNWLNLGVSRSNLDKTIELSSMVSLLRQDGKKPLTIAVRTGVEGRRNFHQHYSPFIQPVLVHTIADRVSFELAPTFAFNTRNEDSFFDLFGGRHDNTIGLGIATGVRILRSTSLVGEIIPRVYGFRGENDGFDKDRQGVSIGLQKSTFRHTFELVVSRQSPMTTSQYAVQGTDQFRIGFNIYRRIR